MAKNEFNPKDVMEIAKQSKVGAYVGIENYDDFKAMIEATDNIADMFGEVEKTIAQKLEAGKDIKRVVDTFARPLKDADTRLRGYLTQ